MFAENNNEPKNEPQTMKACIKIKFCLVLCVWLSKKYKSLLASKIQRCKNRRRQHLLSASLGRQFTYIPSYTQLAKLSYFTFSFLLFVFGICLLQSVARKAAKLLIAAQVLELAGLASFLFCLCFYIQIQTGGLRIFFIEKDTLDFLDYSRNP